LTNTQTDRQTDAQTYNETLLKRIQPSLCGVNSNCNRKPTTEVTRRVQGRSQKFVFGRYKSFG